MNSHRHLFACVLFVLLLPACSGETDPGSATGFEPDTGRPNIVLIITDDQGYGDLGFTGNPVIRTPNLDEMARESARMTTFYVSPVCAPTRASLMTGRYNYRTRVTDTYIGRAMMEPEEVTVAELLGDAGYATGIFGKWHLGDTYPMRPQDQGFDEVLVHRGGGIGQPSDPPGGEGKYTDAILFHNGEQVQTSGYCTDVYFDSAMEWIDRVEEAGDPFFAYIATNAPHSPIHDVPEDLYRQYLEMDLSHDRMPEVGHPLPETTNQDMLARLFAMITNIDQNVGKLFTHLELEGLAENTMVIFMLDNGPNSRRYVAGMRGMKADVHEGGIRSPLFVHWPAELETGTTSDIPAAHIDVLPTLLEAAGITPPADLHLDGRSLLPLLEGENPDWPNRHMVIQTHRGDAPIPYHHFMIRNNRWKLLNASGFGKEEWTDEPDFELYDLQADPLEMHDVAREHPDVVVDLQKEYEAWFDDVGSTRRNNYDSPLIHVGTPYENPTVLTWQDWHHVSGRRWGPESNGYWELLVAEAADFEIHLRFPEVDEAGSVTVEAGDTVLNGAVTAGDSTHTFPQVSLEEGPMRLRTELAVGDVTKGAYQVEVRRLN